MTVLTGNIRDVAGYDDLTVFSFHVDRLRESGTGGVVTRRTYRVQATAGILTTPDLEPGEAVLTVQNDPAEYRIVIPTSATPVELWPLIDAATPPPPGTDTTGFVRNANGELRTFIAAQADYPGLVKDPATLYILTAD